VKIIPETRRVQ